MTPKKVLTIDVKEFKEIELRCECGTCIRFPLPLKNELPKEQKCLGCHRTLWDHESPTRTRVANLLNAMRDWAGFEQKILGLSFVITEVIS